MKGYFKLLKAAGGSCHFAEVGVILSEIQRPKSIEIDSDLIPSKYWLQPALDGVSDALTSVGNKSHTLIGFHTFFGVVADTSQKAVWLAAFRATLDALEISELIKEIIFDKKEWRIVLKSGLTVFSSRHSFDQNAWWGYCDED